MANNANLYSRTNVPQTSLMFLIARRRQRLEAISRHESKSVLYCRSLLHLHGTRFSTRRRMVSRLKCTPGGISTANNCKCYRRRGQIPAKHHRTASTEQANTPLLKHVMTRRALSRSLADRVCRLSTLHWKRFEFYILEFVSLSSFIFL